jgi:hypothetical protein
MTVQVPSQFVSLIQQMSSVTGLPYDVIAAQADDESGFNTQAVSPTGAEGWLQFEPSTYNQYASQAGVDQGTEFIAADEAKVYDAYMSVLLNQYQGNAQNALAAYNAGSANSSAGQQYAQSILSAAGAGSNTVASPNASQNPTATTTSSNCEWYDPLSYGNCAASAGASAFLGILSAFGITPTSIEDLLERAALMIFGGIIIIIGIKNMMSGSYSNSKSDNSSSANISNSDESSAEADAESGTTEFAEDTAIAA